MIDYYSIGRRIQQRRVQRNITQERLAEMVNVSVPHISRIENGSSQPSLQVLVDICNALELTVDDLMQDSLSSVRRKKATRLEALLSDCSALEIDLVYDVAEAVLRAARNANFK
ncbi:MAG: helix-turn-helix transcriptional regulator [Oscillospiraceae bacterium]|nr:helix-turn-helix transcriptional regulator [Oscillospiraceae bacterium]